jgi:hypothetical protein
MEVRNMVGYTERRPGRGVFLTGIVAVVLAGLL